MSFKIKQLVEISEETLNTITIWMYNWWGIKDGYSFDECKTRYISLVSKCLY